MSRLQKFIVTIFSIIFVGLCAFTIYVASQPAPDASDRFVQPEFDKTAVKGVPENVDASLNYQSISFVENFSFAMCADPVLDSDNNATIYATCDEGNDRWIRVAFYDLEKNSIGTTGVIKPGEYVEKVKLDESVSEGIIVAKVISYEPDTYYSLGSASLQVNLHK